MNQTTGKKRLFIDPILFTVSSPTLEENVDLIHQIITCTRSVFIDYASWCCMGAPIVNLLLDSEFFDYVIIDLRFIGSVKEFNRLIPVVYKEWSRIAMTISAINPLSVLQKISEINAWQANKNKRVICPLLLDFSQIIIENPDRFQAFLKNVGPYFQGIIIPETLLSLLPADPDSRPVIIRSQYAMEDIQSIDMSERSRLLKLLNNYDHLLYDTDQILRESFTAFDVLRKFLETHKLR